MNFKFARYVKGADIKAHGQAVIASQDPWWNYNFARFVKGADVKAHGLVIIASKDPEVNYSFAMYVKGADVEAHRQAVRANDDAIWNRVFENSVRDSVNNAGLGPKVKNLTDFVFRRNKKIEPAETKTNPNKLRLELIKSGIEDGENIEKPDTNFNSKTDKPKHLRLVKDIER